MLFNSFFIKMWEDIECGRIMNLFNNATRTGTRTEKSVLNKTGTGTETAGLAWTRTGTEPDGQMMEPQVSSHESLCIPGFFRIIGLSYDPFRLEIVWNPVHRVPSVRPCVISSLYARWLEVTAHGNFRQTNNWQSSMGIFQPLFISGFGKIGPHALLY